MVQGGPGTLRHPCYCGVPGKADKPCLAIQRGLKVSLSMDVCLGMQLGEILCSVPLLLSRGLCCRWIKTEVTQGAGNRSAATGAERPSCRAGVRLPVSRLNPQFTCCCLPGSPTSAGRPGQARVQHILQPGGWEHALRLGGACCPCLPNLRYVHLYM